MKTAKMSEHREKKRFTCQLEGTLRSIDRGIPSDSYIESRRYFPVFTACNMSLEGVCMVTPEDMNPGEIVRVELKVPDGDKTIPALGEVCWSHEGRTGVKLLSVTEEGKNQMRRYFIHQKNEGQ
jgi:hypothetical protein